MTVDLLLVSLGTTRGLRVADRSFLDFAAEAGASTAAIGTRLGWARHLRRAYPAIDLVEAAAARRALVAGLRRHRPRSVVFSTTTAAMLAPAIDPPYAVRLDSPATLNRPGARNAVLHMLERRRLAGARLVLPWSSAAATALPAGSAPAVVLPVPVEPSGGEGGERERLAVAYTPDPKAKGLDLLCAAWAEARVEGARLAVYGIAAHRGRAHLARRGVPEPAGVEWRGLVPADEFRTALRRAHAFVVSARWEDFGQAPLEALADGALLVCAPAGGAFEALPIARELAPRLVADDHTRAALGRAIRAAFDVNGDELHAYREAAAARLAPYRPDAVARTVRERVLPALLRD